MAKKELFNQYRVHCGKINLESVEHFPDPLEIDDYHQNSRRYLLTYLVTGMPVDLVCLVMVMGTRYDRAFG